MRLVSFAVHWIRAEIHEYVLRNWRLVKVATTKAQRKLFFNLRKDKKNLGWLTAEETQAVARDLGVTEQEVTEMEQRLSSRDVSFDPAPDADDEERRVRRPPTCRPPMPTRPSRSRTRSGTTTSTGKRRARRMTQLDARSQAILRARWMDEPRRRCTTSPKNTACRPSASARSKPTRSRSCRRWSWLKAEEA